MKRLEEVTPEEAQALLLQKRKEHQDWLKSQPKTPQQSSAGLRNAAAIALDLASKGKELTDQIEWEVCNCGVKATRLSDDGLCNKCTLERQAKRQQEEQLIQTVKDLDLDRNATRQAMTFENFVVQDPSHQRALTLAVALTKLLIQGKKARGIYLFGNYGVGKTHLAVAVLIELLKVGDGNLYFVNEPTFMDDLYMAMGKGEDADAAERRSAKARRKARFARVLVWDDAGRSGQTQKGSGKTSSWYRNTILMPPFEHRASMGLTTIITSNMSPATLQNHIGGANYDRLAAVCAVADPVRMVGDSFRRK